MRIKKNKQKKRNFVGKKGGGKEKGLLARNNEENSCTELWAEYTNLGLGAAASIKKQVNSIKNSDRITKSKREKGEEFNEHKDILDKVLDKKACPATTKRGVNTTGIKTNLKAF